MREKTKGVGNLFRLFNLKAGPNALPHFDLFLAPHPLPLKPHPGPSGEGLVVKHFAPARRSTDFLTVHSSPLFQTIQH